LTEIPLDGAPVEIGAAGDFFEGAVPLVQQGTVGGKERVGVERTSIDPCHEFVARAPG